MQNESSWDPMRLKLGIAQLTSTTNREENTEVVIQLIEEAASAGCQMVAFPEIAGLTNRNLDASDEIFCRFEDDPYVQATTEAARSNQIWVHNGSTPVLSEDGRLLNRSSLISADGTIVANYDKIHLCDIYPVGADPLLESAKYAPGEKGVVAKTPWGKMGFSICYDVRFPDLYRQYGQAGAGLMFVPAAFTVPTGRAHWETLLRCRAIENGAFVVASAQHGTHADGRETWGHSTIVDPSGNVLVNREEANGLSVVELDLTLIEKARQAVPSLGHDRAFELVIVGEN